MIYDTLNNLPNYLGLCSSLDSVIEFIMARDINNLPAGRTRIDGEKAVVTVSTVTPQSSDKALFQRHDAHIVLETDPEKLLSSCFHLRDLHWQSGNAPAEGETLEVQIRYRSSGEPCRIEVSGGGCRVFPLRPLRAVTPGQAAVFYRGDLLLGGGVIDHAD